LPADLNGTIVRLAVLINKDGSKHQELSMHSKFMVSLAILCCALAGPAWAQTSKSNTTQTTQSTEKDAAQKAQQVIDHAANVLQQLHSNADFQKLAKKAKGIFIVPELASAAIVVGGSGGSGALIVRNGTHWSDPAFFTIGSISIGAQAGGRAGPVAMFLMTDKAVSSFAQKHHFWLNENAELTIVNWSPTALETIGKGDVVMWSGQSGLFAGTNVSGSDVIADSAEDHAYYNNNLAGTKEITGGQFSSPSANKLTSALPG
jgi:SH3 domain-containing YSC84-like protein 1